MFVCSKFLKVVFPVFILLFCTDVMALNATDCYTGGVFQYCGSSNCFHCPENCYCPPRSSTNIGSVACTMREAIRCNNNGNRKIEGRTGGVWGYKHENGAFGIFLCPEDYPFSDAKSVSDKQCRNASGVYIPFNCQAGYYLKAGETECSRCEYGHGCKGGTVSYSATVPQGIEECERGTYASGYYGEKGCQPCTGNTYTNEKNKVECKPCTVDGMAVNEDHTNCVVCSGYKTNSIPMEDHSACVSDCGTDKLLGTYVDNGVCKKCPNKPDNFQYVLPYGKTKATSITDCRIKAADGVKSDGCASVTIYYHHDGNKWVHDNGTVITTKQNYYVNISATPFHYMETINDICLPCGQDLYNSGVTFTYSSNKTSLDTKDQSCSPCQPGNCVDKGICITCKSGKICPTINLSCNDAQSCESKSYIPDESKTKCELCPAGSIANEGGNKCVTGPIVFSDSHGVWHWSSGISSVVLWNNVDMSALEGRQ